MQRWVPSSQAPTIVEPQARVMPSVQVHPVSVLPLQSLSMPSQRSAATGLTAARVSSQSVGDITYPTGVEQAIITIAIAPNPSPSASR